MYLFIRWCNVYKIRLNNTIDFDLVLCLKRKGIGLQGKVPLKPIIQLHSFVGPVERRVSHPNIFCNLCRYPSIPAVTSKGRKCSVLGWACLAYWCVSKAPMAAFLSSPSFLVRTSSTKLANSVAQADGLPSACRLEKSPRLCVTPPLARINSLM